MEDGHRGTTMTWHFRLVLLAPCLRGLNGLAVAPCPLSVASRCVRASSRRVLAVVVQVQEALTEDVMVSYAHKVLRLAPPPHQ